jgi:membrane-bound lytic murein transglycosylase D
LVLNFAPEEKDTRSAKLHFADVWDRIRAGFALPTIDAKEVSQSEAWYAAHPEVVRNIFERSRYYLFHIVEEIEKRGMPMELALLPFVESGFNPFALSSAQASGLWQFIPGTGTRYKLQQNEGYDARRDIIASTTAALDYLQDLHAQFGDWHLALAAYNWGENQVARAIERNRAKGLSAEFARLPLPAETRQYVPRLMAVKQIVLSPASFKIALPTVPNTRYFTTVARSTSVGLAHAARLAEMKVEEFKALNPTYNYEILKASATLPLVIPVDRAQNFEQRLDEFMQQEQARQKQKAAKPSRRAKQKM